MSWQDSGYPHSNQQAPPPPGFFSGATSYPPGGASYPGAAPYPTAAPTYPAGPYPAEHLPASNMNNQYSYGEAPSTGGVAFSDKSIRLGFIRKVYSILMIQLIITSCLIALFITSRSTKAYFMSNPMWVIIALVVTIVCMISMACCESVRRTPPTNYIFLFIFTLAEGFLLGIISATYQVTEVLLAIAICAIICFSLTVFAFQTKIDFTAMGGILLAGAVILMVFGIVLMFFPNAIKPIRLIYAGFGAFLFSIYLVYDTQLMVGGDHKYSISPEEYVFASLNIYVDIVNIFLFILQIIGESRD